MLSITLVVVVRVVRGSIVTLFASAMSGNNKRYPATGGQCSRNRANDRADEGIAGVTDTERGDMKDDAIYADGKKEPAENDDANPDPPTSFYGLFLHRLAELLQILVHSGCLVSARLGMA